LNDVGQISTQTVSNLSLRIFHPSRTVGQLTSFDGRATNDKIGAPGGGLRSGCQDGRMSLEEFVARFLRTDLDIGIQGWVDFSGGER
jgi:hypothetical protein